MKVMKSDTEPAPVIPNTALFLERNVEKFSGLDVYAEKKDGKYVSITWNTLYNAVLDIAFNLKKYGYEKGDKVVLFSPNRLEMLQIELAVMASGGIAVPVFAHFNPETAAMLIRHSGAKYLAVPGAAQLEKIPQDLPLKNIFVFDPVDETTRRSVVRFSDLVKKRTAEKFRLDVNAAPEDTCLFMYTSGTMSIPKCVQLSHRNIFSQQAALEKTWELGTGDRFLSYLPWHHSFGGIFELFSALYTGAAYYLESSYGKNPELIFENWKIVKPTVFFSVPKVYESLVALTHSNREAEEMFFHSGLRFIFTAAAPLPEKLSEEFSQRGIRMMEGWGLTETSPCCTLTDPVAKRSPGVVGKPIPGVQVRLGEENEIQVKGPNVMKGYFNNEEANRDIFTEDGWFRTGDLGEFTQEGLKLVTRKDRIFKLTNGEKVIPSDVEKAIEKKCHYVSFAVVTGGGKEYPVALIFPNRNVLNNPDYDVSPMDGCFCPRNISELGKCLTGCMHDANCGIAQKFSKVKSAMIIDDELSIENNTLTPSLKVIPGNVARMYKAHIENLYGGTNPVKEEVYVIRLDNKNTTGRIN